MLLCTVCGLSPLVKLQVLCSVAGRPHRSSSTSLCLSVLIYKMGEYELPPQGLSGGFREDPDVKRFVLGLTHSEGVTAFRYLGPRSSLANTGMCLGSLLALAKIAVSHLAHRGTRPASTCLPYDHHATQAETRGPNAYATSTPPHLSPRSQWTWPVASRLHYPPKALG